ncbi:MAG TPA: hypothetical protein VJ746_10275 [Nitrospira sp.]|nr:hypothetical protein [Nitrospira sp.]
MTQSLAWLIGVLLPLLSACRSYTTPIGPSNHAVADVRQGEDCTVLVFEQTNHTPNVPEAMRQGGITKLRSADYRESTFIGIGNKCIIAHGE